MTGLYKCYALPTDIVPGIIKVVGVTSERSVVAQVFAIFSRRYRLIHRVHSLQDPTHNAIVYAQSSGFVLAKIKQLICTAPLENFEAIVLTKLQLISR